MTAPRASVIVFGAVDQPAGVQTVISLLRQTVPAEVIAPGDTTVADTLRKVWGGGLPPDLALLLPDPEGKPWAASAIAAARNDYIFMAEAGVIYHPRYVEFLLSATSAMQLGCARASDGPLVSYACNADISSSVLALLAGQLDARTLHGPRSSLAAAVEQPFGSLLDLALRIAITSPLQHIRLPVSAMPIGTGKEADPTLAKVADDSAAAEWFARHGDDIAFSPKDLHSLSTSATMTRPRLAAIAESKLSDCADHASLALGYTGLLTRIIARRLSARPGYSPGVDVGRGHRLSALAALTRAAPSTAYSMICHPKYNAETLAAMIRTAEVNGLAACFPLTDDGLYHPPKDRETLVGVVFRTAALTAVFAQENVRSEPRFWFLLARQGLVGGFPADKPGTPPLPMRSIHSRLAGRLRFQSSRIMYTSTRILRGVARRSRRLARRVMDTQG